MRTILIGLVLVFAVCGMLTAAREPQQKPAAPSVPPVVSEQRSEDTISVDVNLVNILFTVADKKGKFVTNLRKDDFKVFED